MTARRPSLVRRALLSLVAPALLAMVAAPAAAQGKGSKSGHGSANASKPATKPVAKSVAKPSARGAAKARAVPPGQAKKRVTHGEAVDVSRRVLVERGYTIARVERVRDTRVIYYYRGNNGRGKGHGPLQRMVVRPSQERFVFEGAPADVVKAVNIRLHF